MHELLKQLDVALLANNRQTAIEIIEAMRTDCWDEIQQAGLANLIVHIESRLGDA